MAPRSSQVPARSERTWAALRPVPSVVQGLPWGAVVPVWCPWDPVGGLGTCSGGAWGPMTGPEQS